MKVGFLIDRPPIFNGGFSQRILREINLVGNFEDIEVYMQVFQSVKSRKNENVKKKVRELYDSCGVKGYFFSFLVSSKLALNIKMYNKFYIEKVKRFINKYNIDVLICENLWCAYLGTVAAKELGIKVIFDYHGVVPEENEFDGYCKKDDKKYTYLKEIEKEALLNSNSIICVSNSFKKYLVNEFNLQEQHIKVIPCCINREMLNYDQDARHEIRSKLGVENRKVLIYAGSITKYQCIEEMVWIFKELKKKDNRFFFIFLSAYTNYNIFQKLFRDNGISSKDYYIGSVPHNKVQKYNWAADFGLIIREEHLLNRVASPTKIAEYMSAGLTIIGTEGIGDLDEMEISKVLLKYDEIKNKETQKLNSIIELEISEKIRLANYMQCKKVLENTYLWECYKDMYHSEIFRLVKE